ncbi:hypothetical protein [Liquorilactobacillus vini]|uniref:Uncharacterized protein n=1 Tax=Liquorilactobacillus vini DSM 20605 TaxID=1133569 RepID=A0A0R2CD61_9LACO|nr:hypothetical protein [Liquorilactobacillus vini]KRM89726.1 hypothetical protein FD21_GL000019 [Liquorilactobacillus vini DSM 20605]
MFLTTGDIDRSYVILGIINTTVKKSLRADEIDQVDDFDDLFTAAKTKLLDKAIGKNGAGVIQVRFVPQVVEVGAGPKYLLLHAYGTAVKFPHQIK